MVFIPSLCMKRLATAHVQKSAVSYKSRRTNNSAISIAVHAEMGYSIQDNLLRVLLCCGLWLLRPSLGMPTVQTLGEITMSRLNWTIEGVSGYTAR